MTEKTKLVHMERGDKFSFRLDKQTWHALYTLQSMFRTLVVLLFLTATESQ